jgi:hypothetical protein
MLKISSTANNQQAAKRGKLFGGATVFAAIASSWPKPSKSMGVAGKLAITKTTPKNHQGPEW